MRARTGAPEVEAALHNFPAVDVFLAHNSPRGVHERDRDFHQGFEALNRYLERARPACLLHGHQHLNRQTRLGATQVLGVYGALLVELARLDRRQIATRSGNQANRFRAVG